MVNVLKYPPPPPVPGMLKQTSCRGAGSHSVLYTVRHSLEGFSLQLFTTLSSHSSLATTLGTLMHCFSGVSVHFWLASVLHWCDADFPAQLDFETKLQTRSFFGWQPYSARGPHCLVTYLHSFTWLFGQSLEEKPKKHIWSWLSVQWGVLNSTHSSVDSTETTVLQTLTVSGLHSA